MQESNAKHFEQKEKKLNRDLEHGTQIDASMLLLDEVHRNPEEFKALVKRSMDLPDSEKAASKWHLNVDKNGDVFVWDSTEHNGIYAGTAKDLAPKPDCPAPPAKPADAQAAAPAPLPVEAVNLPPASPALDAPPPLPAPAPMYAEHVESPHRPPLAVCNNEHTFKGLNLGLIKIGVYDNHSFGAGVNIGIAKADGMIGQHTGVDARAGLPILGACGSAGVDIDERGLQPAVAGRANVANLVGGGAEAGVVLGPNTAVNAGVEGEALGAHARVQEQVTADDRGLAGTHYADAGFLNWVGANHRAHAELSADSRVGSSAGVNIGPAAIEAGAGVETTGDTTISPRTYLDFGSGTQHTTFHADGQVGPSVDARAGVGVTTTDEAAPATWQNGELQAGVGVSGIGVKAVDARSQGVTQSALGVGPDYQGDR